MNAKYIIRRILRSNPEVTNYLPYNVIRQAYPRKSVAEYDDNLRRLIILLYSRSQEATTNETMRNLLIGEFAALMLDSVNSNLLDAYEQAWRDAGNDGDIPAYMRTAWQADVIQQSAHVANFILEVIVASVAGLPIEPFIARAALWSNHWRSSYNTAQALMAAAEGDRLEWVYGDTDHCTTCRGLHGIVATVSDWKLAGVRPQNPPNPHIECGGWRCKCELRKTSAEVTPNALEKILQIIK